MYRLNSHNKARMNYSLNKQAANSQPSTVNRQPSTLVVLRKLMLLIREERKNGIRFHFGCRLREERGTANTHGGGGQVAVSSFYQHSNFPVFHHSITPLLIRL